MDSIFGFKTSLPIGSTVEGSDTRIKEFEVAKVGEVTETILTNQAYRKNHPQEWLGRMIASFTKSIGDVEVYEEFRKSKFRKLPAIVRNLPTADAGYILALGHMYTHGCIIDTGLQECYHCDKKTKYPEIDLRNIKVDKPDMNTATTGGDPDEFWVQVPTGFWAEPPTDPTKVLSYHDKHWNRFYFRAPTIDDAIKCEKYYSRVHLINFNMRVLSLALLKVESWSEEDDGEYCHVATMDDKYREMLGLDLFDSLDSQDRKEIRSAVMKLPQLELEVKEDCVSCGEDISIDIDPGDFFPLV